MNTFSQMDGRIQSVLFFAVEEGAKKGRRIKESAGRDRSTASGERTVRLCVYLEQKPDVVKTQIIPS